MYNSPRRVVILILGWPDWTGWIGRINWSFRQNWVVRIRMVGIDYLRAMLERNGKRLQSIAILIKDCLSCILSLSKLVTDQNVAFIDQLLDLISRAVVNLGIGYAINLIALNRLTSILINVIDSCLLRISGIVDIDHDIIFLSGCDLICANLSLTIDWRIAFDCR